MQTILGPLVWIVSTSARLRELARGTKCGWSKDREREETNVEAEQEVLIRDGVKTRLRARTNQPTSCSKNAAVPKSLNARNNKERC